MKLFSNEKDEQIEDKSQWQERIEGQISFYKIAIISNREALINRLKSILVLYNILRVKVFESAFDQLEDKVLLEEFDVVLIDIADNSDVEFISAYLNRYISIKSKVYVIGNNDSLVFSYYLQKQGIQYLLADVQLDSLPYLLTKDEQELYQRKGNIITFLGCKGGVGTSQLAFHTVKAISSLAKIPILLIQGASGSADLDFIAEKPIEKDDLAHLIDDSIYVRIEMANKAWSYQDQSVSQFNLIVLDHNINSLPTISYLNQVFEYSNTIVLVINRDPYSLKIAKTIMDERNRLIGREPLIADKRFLICLNDNKPIEKRTMLNDGDIQQFIENKIDFKRNYVNSLEKLKQGWRSKEISYIASQLVGVDGVTASDTNSRGSSKLGLLKRFRPKN